jgi:hypothetical protein
MPQHSHPNVRLESLVKQLAEARFRLVDAMLHANAAAELASQLQSARADDARADR